MNVDDDGGIFYADTVLPDDAEAAETGEPVVADITATEVFTLHSRLGATNVVYLDFNGGIVSGRAWNSGPSRPNSWDARAFDLDGDPTTFNTTERNRIHEIWHRVAEDYAPFDVDITTEEPDSFNETTGWVMITEDSDKSGVAMPSAGAGGVAYVGAWGLTDSTYNYGYYSPAFVYFDNLGNGNRHYTAKAASHELGHNLNLSHDPDGGNNDDCSNSGYYCGHGSGDVSWGPIMGVGYYSNVTQWSKGEYAGATQFQNDVAILDGYLDFRVDDHGDFLDASAAPLAIDGLGQIIATNPETDPWYSDLSKKGVIETRNDFDVFVFDTGAGTVNLSVTPAWDAFWPGTGYRGANLDIHAALYNAAGGLITQSDPTNDTDAAITTSVSAGTYYLAVTGVGNAVSPYSDYGSLGQFFIAGYVPLASPDTTPPSPNPMEFAVAPIATGNTSIKMVASTATDNRAGTITYFFSCAPGPCTDSGWVTSPTWEATGLSPSTTYNFSVAARDVAGNTTTASEPFEAATQSPNILPTADFSFNCGDLSCDFTDQSMDDGTIDSRSWSFGDGATSTATNPGHTYGSTGTYTVTLSVTDNRGGTDSMSQNLSVTAPSMHIGDLDGSRTTNRNRWNAIVTVHVDDGNGNPAGDGVLVTAQLSAGASGSPSCTTNPSGQCTLTKNNLKGGTDSVTFTITNLSGGGYEYVAGDNSETSIVVTKTAPPANQPPSAVFTETCTDLGCSVDAAASSDGDGSIVSYNWSFGDGNSDSGTTASHTYAAGGTYTVTLTVVDNDGASDSTSHNVSVVDPNANQPPTAAFSESCSGLSCGFDGSGSSDPDGTIDNYSWDFGDGTGSGASPTHVFATHGTYTVILTVTDDDGATGTTTHDVTVVDPNGISLTTATGSKQRGRISVDLSWENNTSALSLDVVRSINGGDWIVVETIVTAEPADGTTTDNTGLKGGPSLRYQVCATNFNVCSNTMTLNF